MLKQHLLFISTFIAGGASLGMLACAGRALAPDGHPTRYPPRPPQCVLAIFHQPSPAVPAWDDLGVAEVTCHIDVGLPQCMRRFRAEACRMGGDIVYALPEKALRPREQAILYRGRVAHTRMAPATPAAAAGPAPTPLSPASGNSPAPIVPGTPASSPAPERPAHPDAGVPSDGAVGKNASG